MLAETALLFGAAVAGFYVFRLLRLPTPALLGPMLFAGVLNYLYLYPDLSLDIPSFLAKVVLGVTLGRRFDRGVLSTLRELPLPALITALWMMGASLAAGFFLHAWSDLPLGTALIGSAAGGVTEMAVFAMALGFNVVTVTFIQIFRLVISVVAIPFVARGWQWYCIRRGGAQLPEPWSPPPSPAGRFQARHYVLLALAASGSGWLFQILGVPAGGMIGSMCGTAVVVMGTGRDCLLPLKLSQLAQLVIGVIIAKTMTHDTLATLGDLFLPLLAPTFILLVLCLLLSVILARLTGWDSMTCILATMPAGLTQIVPIAEEFGANVLKVGALHTVRLISIIVLLPWIIRLILE